MSDGETAEGQRWLLWSTCLLVLRVENFVDLELPRCDVDGALMSLAGVCCRSLYRCVWLDRIVARRRWPCRYHSDNDYSTATRWQLVVYVVPFFLESVDCQYMEKTVYCTLLEMAVITFYVDVICCARILSKFYSIWPRVRVTVNIRTRRHLLR